ncbi:hypothetical protein BDN71DRAFT_191854 [Pleurotus eryngii]|uniref:MYND-type domain-containing protein n=1 Tax=Pleurotus eryngii TaxID=5323 RepID=A0A9P5ZNS8_PLEER|nr:hypothetical protein BDN71DRAFT_191854 [Pleurotus eryngii]
MRVYTDEKYLQDIYLRRTGCNIEAGFIGSEGEEVRHGVRFRIVEEPEGSPLRFGKWLPLSTSDLGADWGGIDSWVRAQAASIAKAIILHKYWRNKLSVSFSGMPASFELDLTKWNEDHKKEMDEVNRAESQRERDIRAEVGGGKSAMIMRLLQVHQLKCRGGCGVEKASLRCSKCRVVRYCSKECQAEDWKYHKSICGLEESYE